MLISIKQNKPTNKYGLRRSRHCFLYTGEWWNLLQKLNNEICQKNVSCWQETAIKNSRRMASGFRTNSRNWTEDEQETFLCNPTKIYKQVNIIKPERCRNKGGRQHTSSLSKSGERSSSASATSIISHFPINSTACLASCIALSHFGFRQCSVHYSKKTTLDSFQYGIEKFGMMKTVTSNKPKADLKYTFMCISLSRGRPNMTAQNKRNTCIYRFFY